MEESFHNESGTPGSAAFERARGQIEKKRRFRADLVAYVVVNAFLVGVWAVSGFGYFWPGLVLAGWGVLALLHGWNVFYRQPITSSEIDKELRRSRPLGPGPSSAR